MSSKFFWVLAVAALLGCDALPTRAAEAAGGVYEVGVAKVDITPDYPIRLNGFGGRREESAGITQRIWAKALAIGADADKPFILITLDSLGIRESMVDEVARRLRDKAGIERARIVVAFSHSHTTPKVNGAADTIFSTPIPPPHQAHIDQYTAELTDAIEKVALQALADRQPSTLAWAVGKVGFAKNRRTVGGPVDHDLPMLVVRSVDDSSIRAVYVTYACHCVTLSDNKISGDWAGFAQSAIERQHPGAVALTSIGCGSDSNPSSGVTGDNTAAAAEQGDEIADEVERMLRGVMRPITGPIAATHNRIEIPLQPLPTREQLEATAAKDGADGYNAKFQLEKLARGESLTDKLDYPVQVISIGDSLAMVFLAGEVCVDYSLRLKRELDPKRVWLHGYSNDFCAYIPSERLLREGGYGGGGEVVYFALPTTLASGLEEMIVAEVHRQTPPQFESRGGGQTSHAQPWPLAEALASIEVRPGFVVEVAAAEPLVADPVAIDFGLDGRMWVAEMPDYSRYPDEEFEPTGSVRLLEDADGDGRYDAATTFAAGLRFPTDVKAWKSGVIVCDAPDVIYLEDADGDGKADVRQVLLTGFATHNAQARVNSLQWGLDNWLYGSCGIFGGKIRTSTGCEVDLGGRDFRFRPDTGELEPVTGTTQQGRSRDDWGNWFGCENSSLLDHYPLEDRYLARNPYVVPPSVEVSVPAGERANELYPIGVPSLYALSGPPGRPTAVCGLGIYRDDLLGPGFANNAFVAEPVNQLVHRQVLSPRGATFAGARAPGEESVEFLASTDPWFRPVQLRTGRDGCLYVVDMHRAVIEHQKWIPAESLRDVDLLGGREQGRIFRVRPRDVPARPIHRLDHLDAAGLVAALDSPNGPQRDLAQQTLVERRAREAAPLLKELFRQASRPATRLHSLCTLDGLNSLDAELIVAALADADLAVRRHAIRLSEGFLGKSAVVAQAVLNSVDDADAQVQLQLAYSLGEFDDPRAAEALGQLAAEHSDDPYVLAGVWSSVGPNNIRSVSTRLFQGGQAERLPPPVVQTAVALTVRFGSRDDLVAIAHSLASNNEGRYAAWQFDAAAKLLRSPARQGGSLADVQEALAPVVEAAKRSLADGNGRDDARLSAIRVLAAGEAEPARILPELALLLEPSNSPQVQLAAIDFIAAIPTKSAGETLLNAWRGFSPPARGRAFDVLYGKAELTTLLLEKLAAGDVDQADLDAVQRQRLLTHATDSIREQAARILANKISSNREKIVNDYVAAATAQPDAEQGRAVFAKLCAGCHQLAGQGHEVGPDLAALSSKSRPGLIESILDPNRAVDERYRSYTALTSDGLARAGILVAETSTSVTLLDPQGAQHDILRSDVELLQTTGKSLMPEGFENDLTPAQLNDLVAYLVAQVHPPKRVPGNEPTPVVRNDSGALLLLASNCAIYGQEITFEEPFKNIGYWHNSADHLAWDVDAADGGAFVAYLRSACPEDSAGGEFRLADAEAPLIVGRVEPTGGYDQYRVRRVGRVALPGGRSRLVLRPHGQLAVPNLMDFYALYLVPEGVALDQALAGEKPPADLDAPAAIADLSAGLKPGDPAEYQRIPKIFEHALAAGQRNDDYEAARVLDLALPKQDARLADWQAVVMGGVINGLSQRGLSPQRRIAELGEVNPRIAADWPRLIQLAAEMADNPDVRTGTRYDALRILGTGPWDVVARQLSSYLAADAHPELQMGAVSSVGECNDPAALEGLIKAFNGLNDENRRLAAAALLRTKDRTQMLAQAIRDGRISRELLTAEEAAKLQEALERGDDGRR